jgi:MOSC domain-containing protein YiiM
MRMARKGAQELARLVSVNVGVPRKVSWNGGEVTTGILKEPVAGRVILRRLNLDGDRQADLTVHGGVNKAVYVYPSEHYPYWQKQLPGVTLPWGMFGENLTTKGLREEETHIGDRFRIGSALLMVTQPRLPCFKLGLKFGRNDMPKRFLVSQRMGFYLAVVEEGEIGAGDTIELEHRRERTVSVAELVRRYRE